MAMTDKISLQNSFVQLQSPFPEIRKAFPPNQ